MGKSTIHGKRHIERRIKMKWKNKLGLSRVSRWKKASVLFIPDLTDLVYFLLEINCHQTMFFFCKNVLNTKTTVG